MARVGPELTSLPEATPETRSQAARLRWALCSPVIPNGRREASILREYGSSRLAPKIREAACRAGGRRRDSAPASPAGDLRRLLGVFPGLVESPARS